MSVKEIVDLLGGPAAVGRLFGITGQAVSQWETVPAERVPALERRAREMGLDVRAEHIRPDVDWDALRWTNS